MAGFRTVCWPQILVYTFLLQFEAVRVRGADPMSHKLRRLSEQFHQFKAMTQTRLDMLARNQNRTSSKSLESHVQALNDHYHHMSQDLEHLGLSAAQEIEDLRQWSRKLEKKNKRMEGRLALMETKCLHFKKLKYDPGQDFFNFTGELQSQEERLSALQVQRDELLIGLQGLQESLKNQALRVTRLEGQISEVLQWNGRWKIRGSGMTGISSNMTSQKFSEHRGRNQTHKGGRLWRRMEKPTQPRRESVNLTQTDGYLAAKRDQYHTTKKPKDFKSQKPSFRSKFQSHETIIYNQTQVQKSFQPRQRPIRDHKLPSWTEPPPHLHQSKNPTIRNRQGEPQNQASHALQRPQTESYHLSGFSWDEREEDKLDTKAESSEIHKVLQLPETQDPDTAGS